MRALAAATACLALSPSFALGQAGACPKLASQEPTPADAAFARGNLAEAEALYQRALASNPHDLDALASLVRTQLQLDQVGVAASEVRSALSESPKSAPLLTALAEVQLREGQPWIALESLRAAELLDPCYARIFLVRSRIDRLNSMYGSERRELAHAYAINPNDAETKRAWNRTVTPANDIASTEEYLATTKDVDPELRKSAEATVQRMLPSLSESSQTCQGPPQHDSVVLPLQPSMQDGRHVDGYKLEVGLPNGKLLLGVDTAASGVYLSRAVAQANGFKSRPGDPPGTVHADSLQIGPLTLRDCLVGVSETPFPGKGAGMIGTDLFGSYLVTLNLPEAKLELSPLPPAKGVLPEDRLASEQLRGWTPVYHRQQFLLLPVTLNGKERRLFALDSGIRMSTMAPSLAHLVSSTQRGFTNPMTTTSGSTYQVYRDGFDFEFANLLLRSRTGVLQLDPTAIDQRTGMEIGGTLGFDILHTAVLRLDYRDGLVKVEFPDGSASPASGLPLLRASTGAGPADAIASERTECAQTLAPELPSAATIQARNTGLWDVAHMKVGEEISVKLIQDFITPECRMTAGSLLYGHVTAAVRAKNAGQMQLGIVFQRAECDGKGRKELPLKLIGIVAAPAAFVGLHTQMPVSIGGGLGRQISDSPGQLQNGDDININPEQSPQVVQTGSVRGVPALQLQPVGGPSCSALLTSSNGLLRLGPQTKFLVVLPQPGTPEP